MTATLATWFDDDLVEAPTTGVDHVVVRLGGGRYGVSAPDVAEVVRLTRVTRVPAAPSWVVGVANWRGHVLPLVDVRPLLGLEPSPLPSSARVVVLARDGLELGLLVEAVAGLVEVPDGLAPKPVTLSSAVADLVLGLAEGDTAAPVAVLSTAGLLALRSMLPRRA